MKKRIALLLAMIVVSATMLAGCGGSSDEGASDDAAAVVQQAYRQIPGEEGVLLKGVVSRKKQLIPDLMSTLAERS